MTLWTKTADAAAFIATADSRGTDERVMRAIAFFAQNTAEAEAFWNGDFAGKCNEMAIWKQATDNGALDGYEIFWGDAGNLNTICGVAQVQFAD